MKIRQVDYAIPSRDAGVAIYATLTKTGSRHVVIHMHGFTHNRFGYLEILSGEYAAARGYDHLRFSFYETGRNARRLSRITLHQHLEDFEDVVASLADTYDEIFISGHSFGGLIALLACPPQVKAVSLWDPSFDVTYFWGVSKALRCRPDEGICTIDYGRVFVISESLVQQVAQYPHERCIQEARRFASPAQLIIPSRSIFDASPHAHPQDYADAFPEGSVLTQIPDSDHIFSRQGNRDALFQHCYDFFDLHRSEEA